MQKIPTLFVRNEENMKLVTSVPNVDTLWMWDTGVPRRATVKKDGTNVLVVGRELGPGSHYAYSLKKRRNPSRAAKEAAKRQGKPVPEPTYVEVEHRPSQRAPEDKHIIRAFEEDHAYNKSEWPIGEGEWPAEALGAKIQGGVEGSDYRLYFFTENPEIIEDDPFNVHGTGMLNWMNLMAYLADHEIEGIVWQATDGSGRMAKIKRRDFNIEWPVR